MQMSTSTAINRLVAADRSGLYCALECKLGRKLQESSQGNQIFWDQAIRVQKTLRYRGVTGTLMFAFSSVLVRVRATSRLVRNLPQS